MPARKMQLVVTESLEWMERGACVGANQDLWFAEEHARGRHSGRLSPATLEAKRICNEECQVRETCRDHALNRPEKIGVWGGLDENERHAILDRRSR
jgi:WhiB family redox-sensing transcriptional regulator